MPNQVPDILSRIAGRKRAQLASVRANLPAFEIEAERCALRRREFRAALVASFPAVIAEVKKASPSKGVLSACFDPAAIASSYEAGGAAALSVLTDGPFFLGSLEDLVSARAAVGLPVLRKDFTLDECHVVEAAAHGADAILLIAALLAESEMRRFRELAALYHMAALVEVHDQQELARALGSGAEIIGVNNRNLHTFEVNLATSLRLAESLPQHVVRVSESGIHSGSDIETLRRAGYQAFLVGELLMRASDRAEALRALLARDEAVVERLP